MRQHQTDPHPVLGAEGGEGRERGRTHAGRHAGCAPPNLGKGRAIQIQESQQAPNKIKLKRPTPKYIMLKMPKLKTRRESYIHYEENSLLPWWPRHYQQISWQKLYRQRQWRDVFRVLKEHSTWKSCHSGLREGERVPGKRKRKEGPTIRPASRKMLSQCLWAETKGQ